MRTKLLTYDISKNLITEAHEAEKRNKTEMVRMAS